MVRQECLYLTARVRLFSEIWFLLIKDLEACVQDRLSLDLGFPFGWVIDFVVLD